MRIILVIELNRQKSLILDRTFSSPLSFCPIAVKQLNAYYRWTGQHMQRVLELLQASISRSGPDSLPSGFRSNPELTPFQSRVQNEFASLRKDYEYELERLTREHELQLFRVSGIRYRWSPIVYVGYLIHASLNGGKGMG